MNTLGKDCIGIIGGAGPEACIDLQAKILKVQREKFEVLGDDNYLRVIVDNNTSLPNRDKQYLISHGSDLTEAIISSLHFFKSIGVSVAAIACNSAHIYFDAIQAATSIELIHIIEATAENLVRRGVSRAVLLSTLSMYQSGLYKNIMKRYEIEIVAPSKRAQILLSQVIYSIKAGLFGLQSSANPDLKDRLEKVYDRFVWPLMPSMNLFRSNTFMPPQFLLEQVLLEVGSMGISHVILGCTELPLIGNMGQNHSLEFVDPNLILAEALVDRCRAIASDRDLLLELESA